MKMNNEQFSSFLGGYLKLLSKSEKTITHKLKKQILLLEDEKHFKSFRETLIKFVRREVNISPYDLYKLPYDFIYFLTNNNIFNKMQKVLQVNDLIEQTLEVDNDDI